MQFTTSLLYNQYNGNFLLFRDAWFNRYFDRKDRNVSNHVRHTMINFDPTHLSFFRPSPPSRRTVHYATGPSSISISMFESSRLWIRRSKNTRDTSLTKRGTSSLPARIWRRSHSRGNASTSSIRRSEICSRTPISRIIHLKSIEMETG